MKGVEALRLTVELKSQNSPSEASPLLPSPDRRRFCSKSAIALALSSNDRTLSYKNGVFSNNGGVLSKNNAPLSKENRALIKNDEALRRKDKACFSNGESLSKSGGAKNSLLLPLLPTQHSSLSTFYSPPTQHSALSTFHSLLSWLR